MLCATAQGAQAQSGSDGDAEARVHFEAGSLYYETERYEEALDEFSEAYRLSGRSPLLYNMGQALERLERHGEALDRFSEYLEAVPDSPMRAEVEERIVRLRALHAEWQRSMAAQRQAERLARSEAEAEEAQRREEEARIAAEAELRSELADQRSGVPLASIVSWSAAGAVAVGALATGIMAAGVHSDLADECGVSTVCPSRLSGEINRGERLALTSDILTGLAVLGAATGMTLWLLDRNGETPTQITVAPSSVNLMVSF